MKNNREFCSFLDIAKDWLIIHLVKRTNTKVIPFASVTEFSSLLEVAKDWLRIYDMALDKCKDSPCKYCDPFKCVQRLVKEAEEKEQAL